MIVETYVVTIPSHFKATNTCENIEYTFKSSIEALRFYDEFFSFYDRDVIVMTPVVQEHMTKFNCVVSGYPEIEKTTTEILTQKPKGTK